MEKDSSGRESPTKFLKQRWNFYQTSSVIQGRLEKLDRFLVEFLKAYSAEKGNLVKISTFGDIQSVSNMLVREFQSLILTQCEEDDEQGLLTFLCHGRGLILLQTLSVLAFKISGCGRELANLLVTLLPVILKAPLADYRPLQGLRLVLSECEEYTWNIKGKSFHLCLVRDTILNNKCSESYQKNSASPNLVKSEDHSSAKKFPSGNDITGNSSDKGNTGNSSDKGDTGNSSDKGDTGIPSEASLPESKERESPLFSCMYLDLNGTVDVFELYLLVLTILENLFSSDNVTLDRSVAMDTFTKLIDIVSLLNKPGTRRISKLDDDVEIDCTWSTAASLAVQVATLRGSYSMSYSSCQKAKFLKILIKSTCIQKIIEIITDVTSHVSLSQDQFSNLLLLIENISRSKSLEISNIWKEFQPLLFSSVAVQGLLTFLFSNLHQGVILIPQLQMLSQELLEQFSTKGGFDLVKSTLMKLEDILLDAPDSGGTQRHKSLDIMQRLKQFPKSSVLHLLSSLGRIISVLKKTRRHCTANQVTGRTMGGESSFYMVEFDEMYPASSDMDSSQESAGDMENEQEKRKIADRSGDKEYCPIAQLVETLLASFKDSTSQFTRAQVVACLGRIGVCGCLTPDDLILALLTGFLEQSQRVQDAVLQLITQLILTEIDVPVNAKVATANVQCNEGKRLRRNSGKSPKASPSRSDSGFSTADHVSGLLSSPIRPRVSTLKSKNLSWTCLSQYCLLLMSSDQHTAFKVIKSLEPLVSLGSPNLRGALFCRVILPHIMRYRAKKGETANEPHGVEDIVFHSAWSLSTGSDTGTRSEGILVDDEGLVITTDTNHSTFPANQENLSYAVLKTCVSYLPLVLCVRKSHSFFLKCGGLHQLQTLLVVEELQQPVVKVFEFLCTLESETRKGFGFCNKVDWFDHWGVPDSESEVEEGIGSTEENVATKAFTGLLHQSAKCIHELLKSGDREETANLSNKPFESTFIGGHSLSVILWRTCLQLLVTNELFGQMFCAENGASCSYSLMTNLQEYLGSFLKDEWSEENKEFLLEREELKELVKLYEILLAVCIRFAVSNELKALPALEKLVSGAKQTVTQSLVVKTFLSTGLCDALFKASLDRDMQDDIFDVMKESTSGTVNLETADQEVLQEEWSILVEDEIDNNGTKCRPKRALDEGYLADSEIQSDSSDSATEPGRGKSEVGPGSEKPVKTRKGRRGSKGRQRSYTDAERVDRQLTGRILYPRICKIVFELLDAAYANDIYSEGSKLLLMSHATLSLSQLVQSYGANCNVLCNEGMIHTILECLRAVFESRDEVLETLQLRVLDVVVLLARQTIRADELWDLLTIFKGPSPPVGLLCSALAAVAHEVGNRPRPAFVLSFPCPVENPELGRRSPVTGRKMHGRKKRQQPYSKPKSAGGRSPYVSDRESSIDHSGTAELKYSASDSSDKSLRNETRKTKFRHHGSSKPWQTSKDVPVLPKRRHNRMEVEDDSNSSKAPKLQWPTDPEELPAAQKVRAVELCLKGLHQWTTLGFSLVFWVKIVSPPRSCVSLTLAGNDSRNRELQRMFGIKNRGLSSARVPSVLAQEKKKTAGQVFHVCSVKSSRNKFEIWVDPSNGTFVFRWTKNSKPNLRRSTPLEQINVLPKGLSRDTWHHVVVSFQPPAVDAVGNTAQGTTTHHRARILTIVDGTESTEQDFGSLAHLSPDEHDLTVMLGHAKIIEPANEALSGERSQDQMKGGYQLGTVSVFVGNKHSSLSKDPRTPHWTVGREEAFYLFSSGPHCAVIGQLSKDLKLVPDGQSGPSTYIEGCKLWMRMNVSERALVSVSSELLTHPHLTFPDIETRLKHSVVALYTPIHHHKFHQYHVPQDVSLKRRLSRDAVGSSDELVATGMKAGVPRDLQPIRSSSLLETAHDVGGISVFIYFFAKVVEIADNEKTQADALSVLLSLQRRCDYHAKAMDQEAGYALIKRVLLTPRCQIGYHMLKVLMEAACDGEVFRATNLADKPIQLNIESNAVVRDIGIFKQFLLDWKVWEKAPGDGREKQEKASPLGVWEMLLSTVEILVHSSHAHYKFNVTQFLKAELVQQLLIGCQERHNEKRADIPGPISSLYVNIIQHVMSSLSPNLTVLKAVCEFLLAIHPTKDTIHLDSPTGFYLTKNTRGYANSARYHFFPAVQSRQSVSPVQHISRSLPGEHRNPLKKQLTVLHDTTGSPSNDSLEGIYKPRVEELEELVGQEEKTLIYDQSSGPLEEGKDFEETLTESKDPIEDSIITPNVEAEEKAESRLAIQIPRRSSAGKPEACTSVSSDHGGILLDSPQLYPPGLRTPTRSPIRPGSATPVSPISPHYGAKHVAFSGPSSKPMSIVKRSISQDKQSSVDLKDYDLLNESDFNSLKSSLPQQSSEEYLLVEGIPGFQSSTRTYKLSRTEEQALLPDNLNELRLGLLKLLLKVLFNLHAELVPAVIGKILKAEYLLVWASHDSSDVRELVVQILFFYLQKAEPTVNDQFLQIRGFHLLANQLHGHPTTKGLAEGCLSLLVGRRVDLRNDFNYSSSVDSDIAGNLRCLGVVPVLALLENSFAVQEVFQMIIQHLNQLFIQVDNLFLKAVEHGLLETLCNVAYALCSVQHKQHKETDYAHINVNLLLESLQLFMTCIIRKACSTCGDLYFQLFEELLVTLENLEDQDYNSRDFAPSVTFGARYLRCFAVQVALQFFQELSKDNGSIGGRKQGKSMRFRVPSFLGQDKPSDLPTGHAPQSSWVDISGSNLQKGVTLGQFKNSPANATFSEQRSRCQKVCQMAVNIVVYSKTYFLPKDFVPFELELVDLKVHKSLEGGIIGGAEQGINIDREFAQFLYSFLVEMLSLGLEVGKRTGLVFACKDAVKTQLGRLLVYMLNPCKDLGLACFALHLSNHARASEILTVVLTGSGAGTKLCERVASYLWRILNHQRLTEEQRKIAVQFKNLMEDCGFQIHEIDSQESQAKVLMEVKQWDQTDTESLVQWQKRQAEACKPLMERVDRLFAQVSAVALGATKVVTEIQDKQRQNLLKHNRDSLSTEVQVRKKWRQITERLIHERAVWYDRAHFQASWRLDPTEGPSRVRCRLQRCHMDIADKYIMEEYRKDKTRSESSPLTYLFADSSSQSEKNFGYYVFDTPDTIRYQCRCRNITPDSKTKGMLLIGESHVHFVGEEAIADTDITQILLGNKDAVSISWALEDIQEIHIRRYCLQDNALEIFLTNGRTFLLAFETTEDRKYLLDEFKAKNLTYIGPSQDENLQNITTRWRKEEITNFEYLTELNKTAGRSFNDLMQYPVFPFVLRDFRSDVLDLNNNSSFRILSRPIAVQDDSKKRKYRETYMWLNEEYERSNKEDPMRAPYNYGSHYSNSGTVLHFIVRLPPFTKIFLQYQDGSFDIPDRTFHSMETTWRLSSYESSTDVKELIPEFFFLPDFLENIEGFDFGLRQNGQRVMHVTLPAWAKGSRRLFVRIQRQALESDYVSRGLHEWIDLVFGFKQTGPEAVEAVNVFHPATYYGVDVNTISDPLQKKALKTMIETYGQTPKQLFTYRHPPRQSSRAPAGPVSLGTNFSNLTSLYDGQLYESPARLTGSVTSESTLVTSLTETLAGPCVPGVSKDRPKPVSCVDGLQWGRYVGSPDQPTPVVVHRERMKTDIKSLISLRHGDQLFALEENSALATMYWNKQGENRASETEEKLWAAVISWGYLDGSLKVSWKGRTGVFLMEHCTPDKVTCCAVVQGCKSLFIGSSTGALFALPIKFNSLKPCQIELLGSRVRLQGHKDVVTCLQICHEFSIVVSASRDTTAIIWDLNRLNYVQCLENESAVTSVAISRTSGDIATVCLVEDQPYDKLSVLHLWDVNGRSVSDVTCEHVINSIDFSNAPEGISVNVIAAGLSNGVIRLYSSWDLQHLRDVALEHPINSEHFNPLYSLFSTWDANQIKEFTPEEQQPPAIVSVAFSHDSQRLYAVDVNGVVTTLQSGNKGCGRAPAPHLIPTAPDTPRMQPRQPAGSSGLRRSRMSLGVART